MRYKGDIKSTFLYDVGIVKQELDDYKENNEILVMSNQKLKEDLEGKLKKIEELAYAKTHLTELLIETENKLNNIEIEKNSYEKHYNELMDERNILRDYIEKISDENKETFDKLNKDNLDFQEHNKKLEDELNKYEDLTNKLQNENSYLKEKATSASEKIKNLENTLKLKISECFEFESQNKGLVSNNKNLQYLVEKNDFDFKHLRELNNSLSTQLSNMEKENFDLISKNKNLLISQENTQNELIIKNQQLTNVESNLKEEIKDLNENLEKTRADRDNLKHLITESASKCSALIKENKNLELELNDKHNQIENLKTKNMNLHKKYCKSLEKGNLLGEDLLNLTNKDFKDTSINKEIKFDDEKVIKVGSKKIEENNMLDMIRKEKEKNKEFLEEIRKYKINLNN